VRCTFRHQASPLRGAPVDLANVTLRLNRID
jgi:hypothetical protein